MFHKIKLFMLLGLAFTCVNSVGLGQSEIELIGTIEFSGKQIDQSGLTEILENGTPHNQFGGISGIDYDPKTETIWAIADRGPHDGAVDFSCRVHRLSLKIDPQSARSAECRIVSTTILKDPENNRFSGSAAATNQVSVGPTRFDPEGIRLGGDDTFFLSDEYGPFLRQFNSRGIQIRDVSVPDSFKILAPDRDEVIENSKNQSGRQSNRGMEGLAISEDRKYLYGLIQSPLIQDSLRTETNAFEGLFCRLICYDNDYQPHKQFAYQLDDRKNKLNEILCVDQSHFLVIERDSTAGAESKFKKIMAIDISKASDISMIHSLQPNQLPVGIRPVAKEVFIDLLNPKFGLAGERFPEKIEGLCWGPQLGNGRKTLLVAVDNDFEPDVVSSIYIFSL